MWIFLIAIVLGIVLFKLGVLSVVVAVLKISLVAVIGCVSALGLLMLWIQSKNP
jgi:MFS superfamily sulfate permease-like transporter